MQAGFAREVITPPVGLPMEGFFDRDLAKPAEVIHDELYVRALYLREGEEEALVLAFDLVFFSRETADRLKAVLGRELELTPRQILINCSHTHCGPTVSNYGYHYTLAPHWLYLNRIEQATLRAARQAKAEARTVTLHAGATRSTLPLNRRRPIGEGKVEWGPYPEGAVCDHLPVCLLKDEAGEAVCLLFSVSCHPSSWGMWEISAEYPGVACGLLDGHLGRTASMFLQGCGADVKARMVGNGGTEERRIWRRGTWEDVREAGELVAGEVRGALEAGLVEVRPALRSALVEQVFPLQGLPSRAELEAAREEGPDYVRHWAQRTLDLWEAGFPPPAEARVLAQGMTLGEGLRILALEGEPVAELGGQMIREGGEGLTFPLGYSNGLGLYLVTTAMLSEGGYEVESYCEYGYPAPLAPGIEERLAEALAELARRGID